MPNSIALTRIHTPEDYWNRMALAETVLRDWAWGLCYGDKGQAQCMTKAQQLSDRYHEHWTTTRKDYLG